MKKIISIIIIILLVVCIAAGIVIGVKLSKDWPDDPVYADTMFYTDEGVYYIVNHERLVFYDYETDAETTVCSKPDCEHTDNKCDAYYDAFVSSVMVYNNKLYVMYSPLSNEEYDENMIKIDSETTIEESDLDGSNRKVIYTSNNGTLQSMCGVGDKIYFTKYEYQDPDNIEMSTYYMDTYLFSYNLNWGNTKELIKYDASDKQYNANLEIIYYDKDCSELFLKFKYNDISGETESTYNQIISYKEDETRVAASLPENATFDTVSILKERICCIYIEDCYDYDDGVKKIIIMDMEGDIISEIATYDISCSLLDYGSWCMILLDDENKMLYDIENDKWYIGNIGETWIPDMYHIDVDNNVIFYDRTDYTGIEPGTVFTENPSSYISGNWSEFLAEYFTAYNDEIFDWISVY